MKKVKGTNLAIEEMNYQGVDIYVITSNNFPIYTTKDYNDVIQYIEDLGLTERDII